MFDFQLIQEILNGMWRNFLRTVLTGFAVGWGIFMLIALLGGGQGLQNGMEANFKDDAINSLWLNPGRTSVPYKGLQPGRRIQMTNQEYDFLQSQYDEVEYITARHTTWQALMSNGQHTGTYTVRGAHPDHQYLEKTLVSEGRFLNDNDLDENRKVIVIGEAVKRNLFPDGQALGQYMKFHGIVFRVVGVFKDEGSEGEEETTYIPITTAQMIYSSGENIDRLMFTVGDMSPEESELLAEELQIDMARRLNFDPEDQRAFRIRNNNAEFARFMGIIDGIKSFIWILSILTIAAGMIGVGNIMMVTVKERTKEFGIRKALGATPFNIVWMVVLESIIVTSLAGYIGMLIGAIGLEIIAPYCTEEPFISPTVDFRIIIRAMVLLVIAGIVAGLVPALRAAKVRPIKALRQE